MKKRTTLPSGMRSRDPRPAVRSPGEAERFPSGTAYWRNRSRLTQVAPSRARALSASSITSIRRASTPRRLRRLGMMRERWSVPVLMATTRSGSTVLSGEAKYCQSWTSTGVETSPATHENIVATCSSRAAFSRHSLIRCASRLAKTPGR